MSWLLVAVLVLQESVLTVSASELPETVVVESESPAESTEPETEEVVADGLGGDYLSAIYLNKEGFKLENGKIYKVSYKITSSKTRKIKSGFDGTIDRDAHVISMEADVETSVEYNVTTNGEWTKLML